MSCDNVMCVSWQLILPATHFEQLWILFTCMLRCFKSHLVITRLLSQPLFDQAFLHWPVKYFKVNLDSQGECITNPNLLKLILSWCFKCLIFEGHVHERPTESILHWNPPVLQLEKLNVYSCTIQLFKLSTGCALYQMIRTAIFKS